MVYSNLEAHQSVDSEQNYKSKLKNFSRNNFIKYYASA